jgi:hypothetical protein
MPSRMRCGLESTRAALANQPAVGIPTDRTPDLLCAGEQDDILLMEIFRTKQQRLRAIGTVFARRDWKKKTQKGNIL